MATKGYNLEQTGEQVQAALNKAINLGPATEEADGLMTAADKASLENLNTEINDKVDKVTGKGLSTNDFTNEEKAKLDTAYQVPSTGIPAADMSSGVQTALNKANSAVQPADLVPITEKIPAQASAQNQLADKAFVNSSISTASADFKGTYDSLSELQAVTADKNDYGYVVSTDEAGNTVYSRYKYNGSSWVFEYDLNNSSFTAAEWAAIQSGITAPLVQKLGALPTNADLQSALSGKQATLVSGTNIKTVDGQSILGSGNLSVSDPNAVKVTAQTWTDAQKTQARTNIGAYAKPSGGIPKADLASGVQGSLDLADSAIQARPSGEVDPTITPAEYATQEELAQLEAEVTGLYDAPGMVELYINSNNKWAKSNTKKYLATAVPVQANDVVSLQYRLANVGFRGLFASYPTLGETATNLLASIDAGVLSEEITISQSGYLVIWSFYNDLTSGPLSIIINGRDSTHFIVPVEQQLYQLRTFDSGIKETIDGLSEDVNIMSGEVDAIGESVIVANESADSANKKIGNIEREEITLPISLTINGISGDVGSAINIRTTPGYAYVIFQVSAGDTYSVKTRTGTSNNYPYYVYLTDGNDIIKDRKIAKQSSNAIQEEQIVIPSGVTKMWVLQYEATPTYIVVRKSAIKDLQSQVTEQKETADTSRMISDNGFFGLETDWWIKDRFLEDTYSAQEASALSAFLTKFRARAGQGVFQVGVISDTHGSGAYSWQNILRYPALVCHRSIAVFNKVVEYCDMAFHGGDLSSDYGTSRIRDLQYMYEIARKFCFSKPFFITKGNHDENNNAYIEADMLHLDWANNTYYVRDFSTFSAVTEDSWDGSPLYVSKTELVSDREFRNMVQHWLSPAGATWGNGAYYFYDDDDAKIRIIVGNSFPVNDNHQVSEDEEYLWLAQVALNLSEKSNPAEWKVLMLRHTQSTSLTALSNCINAFRTGASWTYGNTSVDFGAMNGGGVTFLAHIHGHEHMNCFSNGAGYFDIGENSSFVSLSSLGDASKYGISVLSVDMENGIIYEDTIGGKTWAYNYVTGKLEIQVGDTFRAASSGLSSPSASSSDTGVATCDGMVVTAVSAGECNITITGSNGSYVYPIKVI